MQYVTSLHEELWCDYVNARCGMYSHDDDKQVFMKIYTASKGARKPSHTLQKIIINRSKSAKKGQLVLKTKKKRGVSLMILITNFI